MPKAEPLLLDLFPNAAVAYSLRKLRTTYTGAVLRVRRSVDNAEQDFLDTELNSTLTDWVGYNLWTYSEQMQQGAWPKTNVTSTTDTITDPDGNTTGDVVLETTANSTHSIQRNLSVIAGKEYTVSFWIRPEGRDFVRLATATNLSTDGTSTPVAWFDLSTGSLVSENGFFRVAPTIISAPNGWFFITYGLIANNTTNSTTIQLNLSPNGSTTSYVGNTSLGVGLWGIQVSETSNLKTYQKTEAVAGGNGFVTTWYDQSGNANNASQATAANQAQIVSSGAIILDPDTGKISVTWTNDNYPLTSNILLTQNLLMTSVVNRNTINNTLVNIGNSGTTNQRIVVWLNNANSNVIVSQFNSTLVTHETGNTSTGAFIMSGLRDSSDNVKAWRNTSALTTGVASGGVGSGFFNRFATANTLGHTGSMVEMIYWDNDKESSRADIVTNQNNYWNVY